MTDKNLLDICLTLVERKFGQGDRSTWSNFHIEKLAQLISETTHISISASTIQRLFIFRTASNPDYMPQEATKLTFAKFLGFNSWYHFKEAVGDNPNFMLQEEPLKNVKQEISETTELRIKANPFVVNKSLKTILKLLYPIAFLFIGVGITYWWMKSPDETTNQEMGILNHETIKSRQMPVTVKFNFDISTVKGLKGFSVISYKDKKYDVLLGKSNSFQHVYSLPGFFEPTIYSVEKAIAKATLHITNDYWFVDAEQNDTSHFMPDFKGKALWLPEDTLLKWGINTAKNCIINYTVSKRIPANGEDFELNTLIHKCSKQGKTDFKEIFLNIYGSSGRNFGINFSNKDYMSNNIYCRLSEQIIYNEKGKLDAFRINMDMDNHIKIKVKNQLVKVFVNNKQIFEASYQEPLKNIVVLKVGFKGNGKCQDIELRDGSGLVAFDSNKM